MLQDIIVKKCSWKMCNLEGKHKIEETYKKEVLCFLCEIHFRVLYPTQTQESQS